MANEAPPLKTMSPFLTQLLPLMVFIVVDAFVTDMRISILSAVLFAIAQLAFTWGRTRQFDWFVVLDVSLIVGLGGISIAFQDDLFFKVKPAIIEGVTIVFMTVLLLAPDRFRLRYFGRMMPGRVLEPEDLSSMKSLLSLACVFIGLHIGLVLYTAFHSSKEVWAFVSGPGFYLLIIPMGLSVAILRSRRKASEP